MTRSILVYSPRLASFSAYEGYPWYFDRSEALMRMLRRHDLVDRPGVTVLDPAPASTETLAQFHTEAYLEALDKANSGTFEQPMLDMGLGSAECPVYAGCFDYHRLVVGSTLAATEALLRDEADVAFVPSAGMHHAGKNFAAGFCYLNDPVLAILRLLREGLRVLYLDIDAHHGDQVQAAFYEDPRVLTISLHENPETLFPFHTGFVNEVGEGAGKGYTVNLPFAAGTSDDVYLWGFRQIVPPLVRAFRPDIVVAEIGADVLAADPMTHLLLTTHAYCEAVSFVKGTGLKVLALGGGGYLLGTVSRAWTLAWAIFNDVPIHDDAELLFGGVFRGDGLVSLHDRPVAIPEDTRAAAWEACRAAVATIKANQFRLLGIECP